MPTDYAAAILYHTAPGEDIDPQLLATLQEELYLAVHACNPRLEQGNNRIWIPALGKWLVVYEPGVLMWDVEATVLKFDGLAHTHPGTALSRRLLDCENATWRIPFQRLATSDLIYHSAQLIQDAGTLPRIAFTICEGTEAALDTTNYPSASTASYFDTDPLPAVYPPTAAITALLQDVFHNTTHCSGDLVCQPYDGDPAAAGTAVLDATVWDPWEDVTGSQDQTQCPAGEFPEDSVTSPVSHFRWTRATSGLVCCDTVASPVLYVPANHVLRLTAGDCLLNLEWPAGGVAPAEITALMMARYLMGDETTGLESAGGTFTIRAWDADPDDGGSELDSWTIARSSGQWTVAGSSASNSSTTAGSTASTGLGWDYPDGFLTLELPGVSARILKQAYHITASAGNPISLPSGALSISLA